MNDTIVELLDAVNQADQAHRRAARNLDDATKRFRMSFATQGDFLKARKAAEKALAAWETTVAALEAAIEAAPNVEPEADATQRNLF